MEFYKITRHHSKIDVIFTGQQYIFWSDFYGLLAVAERTGFDDDKKQTYFTVHYRNKPTLGGSLGGKRCLSMAKSFIKKIESYISDDRLVFDAVHEDIHNWDFNIEALPPQQA